MKLFFLKIKTIYFIIIAIAIAIAIAFSSSNIFADVNLKDLKNTNKSKLSEEIEKPSQKNSDQTQTQSVDNKAQKESAGSNFFENATYEELKPQTEEELFDKNYLGASAVGLGSATDKTTIDVGAVTLAQSNFIGNLNVALSTVTTYALHLLYLFAVLELVFFGFIWMLQHDANWGKLFFKIIKIGLIFFIIQNYQWLLDTIMRSFAQLAGTVINNTEASSFVFNPTKIWQYGYNSGVHLLQLATTGNNFGMTLIMVILGMGILFVFGLLGIQMIVQMVGFYFVSLGALILLPFGAFTLGRGMLDKAVQAVFQAGIKLMTLIIIIGIAVVVWDGFQLDNLATATDFNINQPLGLFFTALLFLYMALYLPNILSQTVGKFSHELSDGSSSQEPIVIRDGTASSAIGSSGLGDMQAATVIDSAGSSSGSGYAGGGISAATSAPTSINVTPAGGSMEAKMTRGTLAQASNLSKSVSESTVKKIKETVLQAIKEKK